MPDANPTGAEALAAGPALSGLRTWLSGSCSFLVPLSVQKDKKKDLIQIQWFVTIACCYLLLFEKDRLTEHPINLLLLLAPLASILVFLRLPDSAFAHPFFPQVMAVMDTVLISSAIIVNRESPWDLVLVFFFGILIAAIGENLMQIILGCLGLSVFSIFIVPLSEKGAVQLDSGTLLRIPLLFGASVVYGYLSDQVKTERRKTAQLRESRDDQLRTKDQFLSHVSHELRTPLTAVYQFVTILADGIAGELNEEQREYIQIVLRNVRQLQAMVADLLEATRADSGKLAIDPQVILLQSFVPQTLEMLMAAAAVKNIALSARIGDDLPLVYADPQRVNQILTNLIDNGMKFTPAKGRITVEAETLKDNPAWVRLSVIDTGCGISAQATQRIFDRLYQEERTLDSNRKGLGLGLHICSELVARHGGNIWVESKIGEGSAFHFTLPVFSLTGLLLPVVKSHRSGAIQMISVELRLDTIRPGSDTAKAVWRAAWNSLGQLGHRPGTVLLPKMARNEDHGLIFIVSGGNVAPAEVESIANEAMKRCPALQNPGSSSFKTRATAIPCLGEPNVSAERRADDVAARILHVITEIEAEKAKLANARPDYLGAVSREVRTPVTLVMGYATLLRDKLLGDLTPEQENVVGKVLSEITDLMLMVSNSLEAEKLASSTARPANHDVNVNRFLEEFVSTYDASSDRRVGIVWDWPPNLPIIISDGNRLKLIMQNLIHETLKRARGGQVSISARYNEETEALEFSVTATDAEIPRESFHAAFQQSAEQHFLTGEPFGGGNLGFYVANACARLLGGAVTLEESENEASNLKLRLPAKVAADGPDPSASSVAAARAAPDSAIP